MTALHKGEAPPAQIPGPLRVWLLEAADAIMAAQEAALADDEIRLLAAVNVLADAACAAEAHVVEYGTSQ